MLLPVTAEVPFGRFARRWTLTCIAALVLTSVSARDVAAAPGGASPEEPSTERERRDAYRLGVVAATHGEWATAKTQFARVVALRPSPKALFSLAQVEEELGQVASALATYEEARTSAQGAQGSQEAEVVTAAARAEAALEPRVPHVHVVASGVANAAAATATLDDRPIPTTLLIAVDPGSHRLVVRAPGSRPATLTVTLRERQQLELPVRLELEPSASGNAAGERSSESTVRATSARPQGSSPGAAGWRVASYAALGASVVTAGLGAYFGVKAATTNDASYTQGCRGDACPSDAAQTRQSALVQARASTALFITGGALAAGGIVGLLLTAHRSTNGPELALAVGPTGLALEGAF